MDRLGWVRLLIVAQRNEAFDQIINVANTPRLISVSVNGQALALQRLNNEVRDDPPVIGEHVWTVRTENPGNPYIDSAIAMVGERKRLCKPFCLVVEPRGPTGLTFPQ